MIRVQSGRRAGLAVVLDPGLHPRDDPQPLVVTEARWGGRLSPLDFPAPVDVLGHVRVRKQESWRSPADRKDLASRIRALDLPPASGRTRGGRRTTDDAVDDQQITHVRTQLRAHPCHGCPDREEHARWGERYFRLRRENDALERRLEGRTGSLGRTFDRICTLLRDRDYLAEDGSGEITTTAVGRQLARIWSEADLVIAECLRTGAWAGLGPAELAAIVSTMTYEPRREEHAVEVLPSEALGVALVATNRVWGDIVGAEAALGLPTSREPEAGFVWPIFRWVRGEGLERALGGARGEAELPAGDFIRWCKQVVDLLEQLATLPITTHGAPGGASIASSARTAATAIRRGVVAQSMSV